MFGAHGDVSMRGLRLEGAASSGQSFESGSGRWLWLQLDALRSAHRLGGFLLDYREAFEYRLLGAQLEPEFALLSGLLSIRPLLTAASWTSDSTSASFGVFGGAAQLSKSLGDVVFRVTGQAHHSGDNGYAAGTYGAVGVDAYTMIGQTSVGGGVQWGTNPVEEETGFQVWTSHAVSEQLRIDAQISRPLADAVFGSPGTLGFSVGATFRLAYRAYQPPPVPAKVGVEASSGRLVEFRVKLSDARSVAVSGTFSDWQPVALTRAGDVWTAQIAVEPGTHQYGFLVNGQDWYLPPDAKDVIDDGFGRKNATLVVQPK